MILADKIKALLNQMSGVKTVIYDSFSSVNVRLDRKETPAAVLYLVSDWNIDISRGVGRESAKIEVFFCDRAKLDARGEEKDIIVSSMAVLANEFIAAVLSDKTVSVEGDTIKIRSCYGKFDSFVVGVSVELNLIVKQGTCLDDLIPTPTPNPPQEAPNLDAEDPIDNELV